MGTMVQSKGGWVVDADGETGPGVLSGTGQWLARGLARDLNGSEVMTSRFFHNGGWMEQQAMDTLLLSGQSAG